MAEHIFNITPVDTVLGIPQESDGIMGFVIHAVAVAGTFFLDTPYLLTGRASLTPLGITAAYDTANSTAVFLQINEFYDEAGEGAICWLQGTATSNPFATYVTGAAFYQFIQYSATADPDNRIKGVGFCHTVPSATQAATDFPADIPASLTAIQTVQEQMSLDGYPWFAILDGHQMSTAVTPATIGTQATGSSYAVALCITSTLGNGVSQVGPALGRLAKINIGRSIGNAKDGAVFAATAFLTNSIIVPTTGTLTVGKTYYVTNGTALYDSITYQSGQSFVCVTGFTSYTTADTGYVLENGTPVQGLTPTYINQLGLKQYLFMRTLRNKLGFYWNDGSTCINATMAFSDIAGDRIINALIADAWDFWGNEYQDSLPTDTITGNLDQTWINTKQQEFYKLYIGPLSTASGNGSIVDGEMIITGVNYATNPNPVFTINIVRLLPIGNVTGTVQFTPTL